jgi:hypothetical protein
MLGVGQVTFDRLSPLMRAKRRPALWSKACINLRGV